MTERLRTATRMLIAALALAMLAGPAFCSPVVIVAIGASNTTGWGVGSQRAYPALLQAMLRSRGYDVVVKNAGVNFDTTNGMLARLDKAVPDGADLVIIQPGGNDRRFLGTKERRAANIRAMVTRLHARHILALVYDPVFAQRHYQWDMIHLNVEGHAMIAETLLPQVMTILGPR